MEFRVITDYKVRQISLAFGIPLTKQKIRFSIQNYRDPTAWTSGLSSRCMDGRHVLFFDYDSQDLRAVIEEIKYIQEAFKLSNAYVFELDRANSFHVIILDKVSVTEAYEILNNTNVDWGYKESVKRVRGREWILRVAEKGKRKAPKFVDIIPSPYNQGPISTAHKQFLQLWYAVPKIKYNFEDNINTIPTINYNTGNRV